MGFGPSDEIESQPQDPCSGLWLHSYYNDYQDHDSIHIQFEHLSIGTEVKFAPKLTRVQVEGLRQATVEKHKLKFKVWSGVDMIREAEMKAIQNRGCTSIITTMRKHLDAHQSYVDELDDEV